MPPSRRKPRYAPCLEGPVAKIVVRNWGVLIALVGVMLIYGAFNPPTRLLVLTVAGLSKLTLIGLVLAFGTQYLGHCLRFPRRFALRRRLRCVVIRIRFMPSATIKIFLAHGDSKRLRTAELSNWTGKAVAGPRSEFDSVLARDESQNSGVYFLTGIDPETGKSAVYIGEAESIRNRVKGHLDKDFWNHIAFFTSKDENLTKAHIRYLEGRLIEQAKQAGRAQVKNSQTSGSRLPESDREDMEIFLEKIHQLLPVLGVEVLVPTTINAAGMTELESLSCEIKGIKATGHLTPNGIVVLAGSQAVLNERPSSQKYPWALNMRQKLKDDGILTVKTDHLLFIQDVEFSSQSAAAAVIHGGHANGLIAWKNKDGKTLKELESV